MPKTKNVARPVRNALDKALAAARKQGVVSDLDAGTIRAAQALADKIDAWDQIVAWAFEDAEDSEASRPAVPQNDNVSLASFLKYMNDLGLTPGARSSAASKSAKSGGGPVGKLGALQAGVGFASVEGEATG